MPNFSHICENFFQIHLNAVLAKISQFLEKMGKNDIKTSFLIWHLVCQPTYWTYIVGLCPLYCSPIVLTKYKHSRPKTFLFAYRGAMTKSGNKQNDLERNEPVKIYIKNCLGMQMIWYKIQIINASRVKAISCEN